LKLAALCVFCVLVTGQVSRAAEADQSAQASQVATDFIHTLASGETADLLSLVSDPFTVEGRILKGQEQITGFLEERLAATRAELRKQPDARIEVFPYQTAVERFGKPPRKFSHINLKRCLFAAVTYPKRRGFLLILKKHKKDSWRVTAVTD